MASTIETMPELATEHVFDFRATLKPPVLVGKTRHGMRVYYEVTGGVVEGERVNGEILTGGGDWAIVGDDMWSRIDVRGQIRTDDGAILYCQYSGLIEPTETFLHAVQADEETAFDDQYWRATIDVETGDERYAWLTQSLLIGRGRRTAPTGVAYEVFRVV